VRVIPPFPSERASEVLGELSAVVLPSEWDENAPLTLLQARAAGVPVIASSVPGVREVLEPGVHGRLVPPGDARALADAMRDILLANPRRTGRCDLPLALDEHVRRVEAIYRDALAARAAAGRAAEHAGA
jgi:glycosyltransferase involved in cell wall biosynthesis